MKRILLLSLIVTLNMGCTTMSDVFKNKNNGMTRVYPVSEKDAYKIARQIFLWEGSDVVEERKEEHMLLSSSDPSFFTAGTFMGAWIEPTHSHETSVTVVTKRKVPMNIVTRLTETTFHKRFAQAVAILKSGKPLPVEAP